jgi:hypothetical protein
MKSIKNESDYPYEACKTCKTLGDCPFPEVAMDGMGSPLPPECCIKPIDIMNATLKKRKHDRPV